MAFAHALIRGRSSRHRASGLEGAGSISKSIMHDVGEKRPQAVLRLSVEASKLRKGGLVQPSEPYNPAENSIGRRLLITNYYLVGRCGMPSSSEKQRLPHIAITSHFTIFAQVSVLEVPSA